MAMRVNRLVDFPFVLVRLRCDVCKRSGAYRLARLSAKFGSGIFLEDLLARLSSNRALRDDTRGSGWGARVFAMPMVRPTGKPSRRMRAIKGGKGQLQLSEPRILAAHQ